MWAKGAGVQPSTGRRPVDGCTAVHGAAGIVHISTRQHSPKVQGVGGVGGRGLADDQRARAAQEGFPGVPLVVAPDTPGIALRRASGCV